MQLMTFCNSACDSVGFPDADEVADADGAAEVDGGAEVDGPAEVVAGGAEVVAGVTAGDEPPQAATPTTMLAQRLAASHVDNAK